MKELIIINPENVSVEEVLSYRTRESARAVVFDVDGKIALLHVAKKNYYKVPGGGLDEGEDIITALRRECREEIGCDVEVIGEIGSIVEYRKIFTLKQTSYCYVAKVVGKKGLPSFTESEVEDGFKEIWLSYDDAERALAESRATDYEGSSYIVPRDVFFLKEVRKFLKL